MQMGYRSLCVAVTCSAFVFCGAGVDACAAADEANPDYVFPDGVGVYFLSADEAASAIVEDGTGPFFEKLTLLDIELRLGRKLESMNLKREQARFRDFVRRCVLDWTPEERESLLSTLKSVHAKCAAVVPSLIPKKWRFIKTNGKEGGAPYTRGLCLVFPQAALQTEAGEKTVIHETFHVYSRANPRMRARLYRTIGFQHLNEVFLPSSLEAKRLTNPDGADFTYAIDVKDASGRELKVVLVVYSRYETIQEGVEGFFSYVTFGLFEVQPRDGSWAVVANDHGQGQAISLGQVRGFFEQIGRNTDYIIHPDEILADNVALLVLSRSGDESARVRSPDILRKIEGVLRAK